MPAALRFYKYHALGNDYLVMPGLPLDGAALPDPALVQRICHRSFGLGSDGILLPQAAPEEAAFALRIFNPDGSEAEKSGNGLRIFARWLYDQGLVGEAPFRIWTPGGVVRARLSPGGSPVTVEMGRATFNSQAVPMSGPPRQVVDEPLELPGETLRICALSLGNPHCVVLDAPAGEAAARRLGPLIENHPAFPRRTNVQLLQVLDRARLAIHIWERGAGYTLASGSSACAAAAAAHRLGRVEAAVTVHCPGGDLLVEIGPEYALTLTGPVTFVAEGTYFPEKE